MKKGTLILLTLTSIIVFYGCSKDDAKLTTTTQQKIQGIWKYEKSIDHIYSSINDYRDTIYGAPGDYVDFRSDNKVYIKFDGDFDTMSYTLLNDSQIYFSWLDNGFEAHANANITTLTDNQFNYYAKDSTATVHEDLFDYLTR